jgi:hypothetical protein
MRPVVHGGIHFPCGPVASTSLEAHFVPFTSFARLASLSTVAHSVPEQ